MLSRGTGFGLALSAWIAVAAGCGGANERAYGEPVDSSFAVPLSKLLSGDGLDTSEIVTVSGRVGEVCESAGCWFVLQDTRDGKLFEILTDLKPAATFTLPTTARGQEAVVRGRLVGKKPDLKLNAIGVRVE